MALKMLSGNQFGPLSPKQTKLLVAAREDSDRLYRIIENLLNISRIESGRVEFQFRPMLARDIVSLAADPMRSAFSERNIELDIDLPADLPRVRVDPVVITSALSNLLSNALKFTPPGGRVSVTATADEAQVSFAISDTGPGIPVEFRSRIFEKFFRVPMSAGPSGAGLGLSITKDIIEAHGGQIGFDCPDTGGTIFRFQIPLDRSASTGSSVAAATKDSAMSDAILDPQG
jgi:signal transduction histidine kinase